MDKIKIPWVCGTLMRYKSNAYNAPAIPMFTASVIFRYPIVGSIVFRQPRDQPWVDTTVIVEYLVSKFIINYFFKIMIFKMFYICTLCQDIMYVRIKHIAPIFTADSRRWN